MKLSFLETDTGPETDYVIGTPPVVKLLYDVTVIIIIYHTCLIVHAALIYGNIYVSYHIYISNK